MKSTKLIMGMPITVELVNTSTSSLIDKVFSYFESVDEKFSTYKPSSEISQINRGEIIENQFSPQMKEVFKLAQETKKQTHGYFDIINPGGFIDPSGLVKGWAIYNAAKIIEQSGTKNFYIEAGGDIEAHGLNPKNQKWNVGIKNPFNQKEVIKIVHLQNQGIATSGNYERGKHIYNPINKTQADAIASISIIAANVYEADRFATAAFAMGKAGINFIEGLDGLEGYIIDNTGIGTETSGFNKFTSK